MNALRVKYPNINAKLKGMYSKRITKEDLEDLIKQNSLKNAVLLLKTKSQIFKNTNDDIDRLEIEALLEQEQINDILKINKLLSKKDEILFKNFLEQYEIKCIKSVFRKLFANDKSNIIIEGVKKWTVTLFEDIKGIETVENFEEFFKAIERMKYSSILKKYKNNINIFELENEIDRFYFENIYDKVQKQKNLKKIIGSEIDLLNVSWIYRIKKYYGTEKEKLNNILINRNYKLTKELIKKLIDSKSYDEMKQIMLKTTYKEIFTEEGLLELNIDRYLYNINKAIFKEDITSIAYIFAYVNIIDYENNDIINSIEGIRYNMDKIEILKRLVR